MNDESEDQHGLLNPFGEHVESADYKLEIHKPFCNLVFVLPMIAIYELAALFSNVGNGANHIMQLIISPIGRFGPAFIVIGSLLAWQLYNREAYQIKVRVIWMMFGECIFHASMLILLGQLQMSINPALYFGAGVYEEFLFRVLLIPVFCWVFWFLCFPDTWALVLSVIATSIVFSLAHYTQDFSIAVFFRYDFVFRTLAGIFFAVIYLKRGYGIAAGTHTVYDLIVSTLN